MSVLIVDDEPLSRDGLRRIIDWESLGFAITDTVADGLEAQRRIAGGAPDVLLTDIKMPLVDGLELIRWVRDRYPQIASIILSGYDEFDLAREALRLGAESYLLKPVEPSDLMETLLRIRRRLEEDEQRFQELMRLRRLVREQTSSSLERSISLLLRGLTLEESQVDQLRANDLVEHRRHIAVALCECSPEIGTTSGADSASRRVFWRSITELPPTGPPFLIPETDFRFAMVDWSASRSEATIRLEQQLGELRHAFSEWGLPRLSAGIAMPRRSFADLVEAYREAEQALNSALREGGGLSVTYHPGAKNLTPLLDDTLDSAVAHIVSALRNRSEAELAEALDVVSGTLTGNPVPLRTAEGVLAHIVFCARDALASTGVEEILPPKWALSLVDGLVAYSSVPMKIAAVRSDLLSAIREVTLVEAPLNQRRIARAQRLIAERYSHFDLSLEDVASEVGTSPNYLTALLKSETGKGFVDHVTELRIQKAKELLARRDLKTYEVARRVGYQHPSYFSTVFRSQVGLSPSDFRENLKRTVEKL
ncbi:MAG: response regulator [Spirochaetaceae bacterium]